MIHRPYSVKLCYVLRVAIRYEPAVSQCEDTSAIYMYVGKSVTGKYVYSTWNSLLWSGNPSPPPLCAVSCCMDIFPLINYRNVSLIIHIHLISRLFTSTPVCAPWVVT